MIYKLRKAKDEDEEKRKLFLEDNPGLELIPEYAKLDNRQFIFVCLVTDPSRDNPVRTLPTKEKREKAARIAGFLLESDGKRLDRNGRDTVAGNKKTVEEAILKFKELHFDERLKNKEALKKQIFEIREFLESDKKILLIDKGKAVLNSEGKEISIVDQKALKLAVELGIKLPDLEEALNKLEALEPKEETKFEGTTYTVADIPENSDESMSLIDQMNEARQQHNK